VQLALQILIKDIVSLLWYAIHVHHNTLYLVIIVLKALLLAVYLHILLFKNPLINISAEFKVAMKVVFVKKGVELVNHV